MALTIKNANRCGLGRLTVNFKNNVKSSVSVMCSRKEAKAAFLMMPKDPDSEVVSAFWNGKKIAL